METKFYHGENNPRNSEGSFIKLTDGRILLAYTRYTGASWADAASADIVSVVSSDGGKTWKDDRILVKHTDLNVMSVSLLRLKSGRIGMLYLEKSRVPHNGVEFIDCRPKFVFSEDEMETWSEPVDVTGIPPLYMCVNNDRMIQLESGRLVIPAAIHPYKKNAALSAGYAVFYLSDDDGLTWHESEQCCTMPHKIASGLQEPGVIELKDGRLMAWFRTSDGCQYKSFSPDQGESWTQPVPAPEFPAPTSPLSMKRNPVTGELAAIWNDLNPQRSVRYEPQTWGRTPLVMAKSRDEGKTWTDHVVLEDDPSRGFAYIAMLFEDGKLFLEYCCGGGAPDVGMLQDMKIRVLEKF